MEADTLTALKQSIEKWERNAVAETPEGFSTGPTGCALCGLFWDDHCTGCPVSTETGQTKCYGTPYRASVEARDEWIRDPYRNALRDATHAAARDEAAFLRSLLTGGEDQ